MLLWAGVLALLAGGATLAWLWPRCSGASCPSVDELRDYTPPQATRVFDREGKLLAHLAPERRIVIPLDRVPVHLAGAFLAVEDRRFFEHEGVDYRRAIGAAVHDIRTLSFDQGFSTITMQLARNLYPEHLTRAKTLRRKLWEILLANEIEDQFSKDEILEMYLNQIYLGNGLYGVEAAAIGYFGKSAAELTPAESALLAALPKAPSTYDPRRNPVAAVKRRNLVLSQMAEVGIISAEEAERVEGEPLGLAPPPEAQGEAPFFIAAIRRELRDRFGPRVEIAGLRVHTTVDRRLQAEAEETLRERLAAIEAGELGPFRGPVCSNGPVEKPEDCLQGLFTAMDVKTGDVLALVGGRDFSLSQYDRVFQARRQPGSAFKPFVYAAAIAAGVPVTTPLVGPGSRDLAGDYQPADHVADSVALDMRGALRLSSNRAAVALGERVGVDQVIQTAHNMGISTEIPPYPSTFLGAASVSPLEMVSAYTAFANYGIRALPRLILRVEDSQGRTVMDVPVQRQQALPPEVAFITTSLMTDVIDHGTGYRARAAGLPYSVPAAGKTGTTDEYSDAWFVGFTPEIAAAVWVGFDKPRRIMPGAEGGKLAAPIWGAVLGGFYENRPPPPGWLPPLGVVSARIDASTGMLATSACPEEFVHEEWFLTGTEPAAYCPVHGDSGVDGWFRRRIRDLRDLLGS